MSGDAEQTGSLFYIKRDLLTEMVLVLHLPISITLLR